jgi:hypothetical protein
LPGGHRVVAPGWRDGPKVDCLHSTPRVVLKRQQRL